MLQTPTRAGPVLPGGHVFLDVLRGAVLAHVAGRDFSHRVQSDAVPALDWMGHTRGVSVHVRGTSYDYYR